MAATTLSPDFLTATTLSGGNLVATSSGAGGARSTRSMSVLTYFEGTITTLTGTPLIGIADSRWDHATALGTGANTIGYQPSGIVRNNNATIATLAAYVQGNTIGVAVDVLNRLIWFRVGSGNWNNVAGNDPGTGVGGIDFSGIAIGSVMAAISASLTGNVWTTVFTAPFATAAPTGYGSMDTLGTTVKSLTNPTDIAFYTQPAAFLKAASMPLDGSTLGEHFYPAGAITKVSGTTKEGATAVAGRKVEVYDRITGQLIGSTISDGSGNWQIYALGRPAVRVVGSDPTTYNSQVYDNVVPV